MNKSDMYQPPGAYNRVKMRRNKGAPNPSLFKAVTSIIPRDCSVIDLGCNEGKWVLALRELGYEADGVDGIPGIYDRTNRLVRWIDLTGDCSILYERYDWALFIEVGEHVPVEFESKLIDEVCRVPRKGLITIWAAPGQKGVGHINCRPLDYVADEISKRDYNFDDVAMTKADKILDRKNRGRLIIATKVYH